MRQPHSSQLQIDQCLIKSIIYKKNQYTMHDDSLRKKSISDRTMLSLSFLVLFLIQTSASIDSITSGLQIKDKETIVSRNGTFELGFFRPGNSMNRYLGIWYKNVSPREVVWVANRNSPLVDSYGVLNLTRQGVLRILDGESNTVWKSNVTTTKAQNPVLQLLDSGNLVVRDGNVDGPADILLWQSFDYPCDTLLPQMKIGRNFESGVDKFLTSWRSAEDPAEGQFSLWIDPLGYPQLVLRNGSSKYFRLGSWNGLRFSGTPELPTSIGFLKYEFMLNRKEVQYSYEVPGPLMTRLLVNRSGFLERFARLEQSNGWRNIYLAPRDLCDYFSICGAHMTCNFIDNSHDCSCLEGFVPVSSKDWSKGCVRKTLLNCTHDVFQNYSGLKLPDTSSSSFDKSMSLAECKEMCLRNCSCTAYAYLDIREAGSGCLLWFGDLIDMRDYGSGGQDLYIRMSSSGLDQPEKRNSNRKEIIAVIVVGCAVLVGALTLGLLMLYRSKKKHKLQAMRKNKGEEETELPTFDLAVIRKATDNFSSNNKLGQGGFGPVYKGTLSEGQEIAVKRLSKASKQGLTEFKNEVILIAKLQHRNLVKLLGCCIEGEEILLVYEFMPNKSLDFFIFDQARSKFLDWQKRHLIIEGIARGLLYLHQDSRLRIIHRDLKASNVLLDKDMNPKISDFGMARMFGGDQTEANTNKVVGTYGYMSPEYAVDGLFSMKSDIFSFGVLVLEIVSGKKNRGFSHPDHRHNLLGHAWNLWMQERPMELVEDMLDDCHSTSEVLRCIQVGLLCVQQRPDDRPTMSSVVLMLGTDSSLPEPKQPGFYTERYIPEVDCSYSKQESSSTNEVTISLPEAR